MKLLFINQFFFPENAATAHLLGNMSRALVAKGHSVTVICGNSPYVIRETVPKRLRPKTSRWNSVQVISVNGTRLGKSSVPGRLMDYASFYKGAFWRLLSSGTRFDVIIAMTTPPFIYLLPLLLRRSTKAKTVLWNMDSYPQALKLMANDGGLVYRSLTLLNRLLLRKLDACVALDDEMKSSLEKEGARNCRVIKNYENPTNFPHLRDRGMEARRKYGVTQDELFLLYAGNLGLGHEFETLLKGVRIAFDRGAKIALRFVGGGKRTSELHDLARKIGFECHVYPYVAKPEMSRLASSCDFGVVTMKNEALGIISPSKIHGFLATGVPLLYVGPSNSEIGRLIRKTQCGFACPVGKWEELANYLVSASRDPKRIDQMGRNARQAFANEYTLGIAAQRFHTLVESLK